MNSLFDTSSFMPHGHCFLWRPEILWLHVISDAVIAAAYYSIPVALFYFLRKRQDFPVKFRKTFLLFGIFILCCGTTHALAIYTIWVPAYFAEGLVKALTAISSLGTAIVLWPIIPYALSLPTRSEIENKNQELRKLNQELESKVEERTRDSRRLAAIVNFSQDAIIGLTVDGTVTSWNRSAELMYGYSADEMVGQSLSKIIPDDVQEELKSVLSSVVSGDQVESIETIRRKKSGEIIDVWTTSSPIKDESGKTVGISKSDRDITERKRMRDELVRVSRAKDDFLTTVTHELRSPLNVVIGYLDILKRFAPGTDEYGNALEAIKRSAKTQLRMVDELLDMARAVSGKLHLLPAIHNINEIADHALDSVRFSAQAKDIEIVKAVDSSLTQVLCDEHKLQQALWNLLSNAVKFTGRGGKITLRVSNSKSHLLLTVTDTGRGITAEELPHVFDRLWQRQEGRFKKTEQGLGLGLFISKQIVEGHGGSLTAESGGEGQGSRFTIHLPIQAVQISTKPHDENREFGRLKGMRVLVVDDSSDALEIVQIVLKSAGAIVVPAHNGAEALEVLKQNNIDLIISDIHMPEMDGFSFIREARQVEVARGKAHRPAIALTAFSGKSEREMAFNSGFQVHLIKPVPADELISVVAKIKNGTG